MLLGYQMMVVVTQQPNSAYPEHKPLVIGIGDGLLLGSPR